MYPSIENRTYRWKFNQIPTRAETERFYENQVVFFARNTAYLVGADGRPLVDTFIVEHNSGITSLEFQFNGRKGSAGDLFCFPGYYPGDVDEHGRPLFNVCRTGPHYYGQIISYILQRASKQFDMEYTTSEQKAKHYQTA